MPKLDIGFALQHPNLQVDQPDAPWLQIQYIIEGLRTAGHSVDLLLSRPSRQVLSLRANQDARPARLGLLSTKPGELVERAVRRGQAQLKTPYLSLFEGLRMAEACVREFGSVDLIHERNALFGFGAALASRHLRKPYVLSVDAEVFQEFSYLGVQLSATQRAFHAWCSRYSYRRAGAITCVSAAARENLVQNWQVPGEKVHVIPNGVDLALFAPDSSRARLLRDQLGIGTAPMVVCVSGFWRWHALDELVDAFAVVLGQVPDARLVLVGDGVERASIEAQVCHLGLQGSVLFSGLVSHEEVPAWLGAADVAVTVAPKEMGTSYWGCQMKLREYMAAAKAIVATAIGEVPEVIEDGVTGVLVAPGDGEGLSRAMVGLLNDSDRRRALGCNARAAAIRQHSWAHYVTRLEAAYDSALCGHRVGKEKSWSQGVR